MPFPGAKLISCHFLCVKKSAVLHRSSFISLFFEPDLDEFVTHLLTTLKSLLLVYKITVKRRVCSSSVPCFLDVAARTSLTSLYYSESMLSSRSHASQTSTFRQRTRDQYVNRLRLSLRCLRPGEAISSENKRELVGRHSRGLSQTCRGVWLSCAQPDRDVCSPRPVRTRRAPGRRLTGSPGAPPLQRSGWRL